MLDYSRSVCWLLLRPCYSIGYGGFHDVAPDCKLRWRGDYGALHPGARLVNGHDDTITGRMNWLPTITSRPDQQIDNKRFDIVNKTQRATAECWLPRHQGWVWRRRAYSICTVGRVWTTLVVAYVLCISLSPPGRRLLLSWVLHHCTVCTESENRFTGKTTNKRAISVVMTTCGPCAMCPREQVEIVVGLAAYDSYLLSQRLPTPEGIVSRYT